MDSGRNCVASPRDLVDRPRGQPPPLTTATASHNVPPVAPTLDSQDAEYQDPGQATRAGPTKTPPPTNHLRYGKRKEWGHVVEPKILPHVPHAPSQCKLAGGCSEIGWCASAPASQTT
ncbi:hypothetical protein B0T18DRAFT_160490 [Schizothecium vesticola]|uniref:Uncharacterized protein n=1 Tax=Schizothecium vesticola TaxID=314040 RepID=A0AA40EWG2_9PEZI|nr:hypothetical protein B0T18DRAFT_160490 [Schizothecium vesticola]